MSNIVTIDSVIFQLVVVVVEENYVSPAYVISNTLHTDILI